MNKPKITLDDFKREAARLRCTVADIETVALVESNGEAFYDDGFPVILFERHKFYKYCDLKFRAEWTSKYPRICNSDAGGYGKAGQNQRDKFNLAFSLDPIAAMMSCSWGKFQLMGFNHKLCGFDSVGEFVDAMKQSEGAQLAAFSRFVISCGLSDELRNHQWARFAQGYNGAKYKENHYDEKLAAAQKKFAAHKDSISAAPVAAESEDADQNGSLQQTAESPQGAPMQAQDAATGDGAREQSNAPADNSKPPVEVSQVKPEPQEEKKEWGVKASAAAIVTFLTTFGGGVIAVLKEAQTELIYGFFGASAIVGVVFIIARFIYISGKEKRESNEKMQREQRAHEVQMALINSAARKDLNAVTVTPQPLENSDAESKPAMFAGVPKSLTWKQRILGRV